MEKNKVSEKIGQLKFVNELRNVKFNQCLDGFIKKKY